MGKNGEEQEKVVVGPLMDAEAVPIVVDNLWKIAKSKGKNHTSPIRPIVAHASKEKRGECSTSNSFAGLEVEVESGEIITKSSAKRKMKKGVDSSGVSTPITNLNEFCCLKY